MANVMSPGGYLSILFETLFALLQRGVIAAKVEIGVVWFNLPILNVKNPFCEMRWFGSSVALV